MSNRNWTITQLVTYIKDRLSNDFVLKGVHVIGEIGNFTNHFSGHWYFTLKDEGALISCCMFRYANSSVDFLPKNSDSVEVTGNVNIFEKNGQLQLVIATMKLSGSGDFYQRFEQTRKKLEPLGYFDTKHKKAIPVYTRKIAVITGANTAALQDIRITISKRWPMAQIVECNAIVQGEQAIPSIISALKQADTLQADVILLARGGGSVDDLWCFNDEMLATAIFNCKTPVVTGIGHEIDTTIADLVADKRCATPTAAAQAVTADSREVTKQIDKEISLMKTALTARLERAQQYCDHYSNQLVRYHQNIRSKQTQIEANLLKIEHLLKESIGFQKNSLSRCSLLLNTKTNELLEAAGNALKRQMIALDAYSPLKTLERGYAIISIDGRAIKTVTELKEKDCIDIRMKDGIFKAEVMNE